VIDALSSVTLGGFRHSSQHSRTGLWRTKSLFPGNGILQGGDKAAKIAADRSQRQNARTNPRQFGAIRNEPGNLCLRETSAVALSLCKIDAKKG
jgi:hypothetical protein